MGHTKESSANKFTIYIEKIVIRELYFPMLLFTPTESTGFKLYPVMLHTLMLKSVASRGINYFI